MRRILTAFIVLLAFTSLSAYAQKAAIKGKIVNEQNVPLSDANISIDKTKYGAVSNRDGAYYIGGLNAGTVTLKVSILGYKTAQATITLPENGEVEQNFTLVSESEQLAEVVISANTILGSKHAVLSRTGSAYYISPKELQKFSHTDANRILATVPGVNVFEEDGFGLRPNVSLRGSSPSRSSKITIMEDGVLAAPAPYASPAAYYFPTIGRMDAIEILKGSSQIQYGPFTTGGAINMVSAQIPTKLSGRLEASRGMFNNIRGRVTVGNSHKYVGYVVDYTKYSSDGFKKIDNGDKSGFDRNDLVAKLRLNTDMGKSWVHALNLKFQYSNEVSDETYLGLTSSDFALAPFRRYAASAKDRMTTKHTQYMATYTLGYEKSFLFTLTAYRNTFSRNWYKLESATLDKKKAKLDKVLSDPEKNKDVLALLTGEADNTTGALAVKANNRNYVAQGIQAKADYHFTIGETFNDVEIGLRLHSDHEDRFQWVDRYNMIAKTMVLKETGVQGSDANRLVSAKAFAGYVLYKFRYKNLYVTPGIRYEHITLKQNDYGKKDPDRKGNDLKTIENKVGGTFIPGIGVNYRVIRELALFAGVHRGFAPPGVGKKPEDAPKPEKSINYELGARFTLPNFYAEVGGFFNQYSNMLGSDLVAAGGTGTLDQFNAGAANVMGMELLANYDLRFAAVSELSIPLSFAYTLTSTGFLNEFESDIWGEVKKGDEIPYIAKHQLSLGVGAEYRAFSLDANLRYSSGFRTKAGTGEIPKAQKAGNSVVCDIIGRYAFSDQISFNVAVNNLFNHTYLASLSPYGARPGMPLTVMGGVSVKF